MYNNPSALPATGLAGLTVYGLFGWLSLAVALITFGYLVLATRKLTPARWTRR